MMRLLVFHLLFLILLPVIWHVLQKEAEQGPGYAGTEAPGAPLTDSEQNYYNMVFSYAMQNLADGKSYSWQVGKSSGSITVGPNFVSKSHSFCREYAESAIINGTKGTTEGYACRRAEDEPTANWCKLRAGDALTCALEHGRSTFDNLGNSFSDFFRKVIPSARDISNGL